MRPGTYGKLWIILAGICITKGESPPVFPSCSPALFQCQSELAPGTGKRCISREWVCDGEADCPDGDDEKQSCSPKTCPSTKFACTDNKLCIPIGWKCDGEDDCLDRSDEATESCRNTKKKPSGGGHGGGEDEFTCQPDQYRCPGTTQCIRFSQLCDGRSDCRGSEDEGLHCRNVHCLHLGCQRYCKESLTRGLCYCDLGYYANGTACQDINECEHDGYCDQTCVNTVGSYSCSCVSGYSLQRDGRTCKAEGPTYMVLSDGKKVLVHQFDDSHQHLRTARSSREMTKIITMDVDYQNNTICWIREVEGSTERVFECASTDALNNTWTIPMAHSLKSVKQMAKDWISGNWYFTDDSMAAIFMCDETGVHCIILITTNLKGPVAIAVDPAEGSMFFTNWGDTPKLESTALDGSSRVLLVNKRIVRPYAITLDYVNKHVYWSDTYLDRVERIDYYGDNRKHVIHGQMVEHIYGMAMFENRLYLANSKNGTILSTHRFNAMSDGLLVIKRGNSQGRQHPIALRILHPLRQPDVNHPCKQKGCQQFCLPLYNATRNMYFAKCMCRAGFTLQGTNCSRVSPTKLDEGFLLFANARQGVIKGIRVDNDLLGANQEVMTPIKGLVKPRAIDVHVQEKFIYYSDVAKFQIGRVKVDGTERNDSFISADVNVVEGIAIDWMGNNIYWTDDDLKTINVASLVDPRKRKVLIEDQITHPRAIVLDPSRGYMYFTDWVQKPSRTDAKIERAYMDGTNRTTLVSMDMQWPNGLSIDPHGNKLYWCDAYMDWIRQYDLVTQKVKTLLTSEYVKHPYGLVHIWQGGSLLLYWTEYTGGQVMRANMTDRSVKTLREESPPLFEIRHYSKAQLGSNKCTVNNGGCSDLCLARPKGFTCACPLGKMMSKDNATCEADEGYTSSPSRCKENQFMCNNTRCISDSWKCDGDNDCGDNSDEDKNGACKDHKCGPNLYACNDNRCIFVRWRCDGDQDCRGGEDELGCNNATCPTNYTQCPNSGRCLPTSWLCDHDNDCGNAWDEQHCNYTSCRSEQFTCAKNKRCIPLNYVCDGDNDCHDNSDETNCETVCLASEHRFKCRNGKKCLTEDFLCDGIDNCGDGSDEENCSDKTKVPACLPTSFKCDNNQCISNHYRCDGDDDCGDKSDEKNCTEKVTCDPNEFRCKNGLRCIPKSWQCDGDVDCNDNSDEEGCATTGVPCPAPKQYCLNDTSTCLNITQLCDNVINCKDGSDESDLCAVNLCSGHGCSHNCHNGPYGPICYCPDGKDLGPDNRTCSDSDPCGWGVCSQNCTTPYRGGHKCTCHKGYQLDRDEFTCKPLGNEPVYIIFSNRHELRRLNINEDYGSFVSLVSGLRNTIALDFLYEESLIFWTDVVDDKIYRGKMIANSITNIEHVVQVGLATAEGLAVDWIGHNIYWVESNLDQIEVAHIDGQNRSTLIAGNMESPRAIALDPRVGILFWSDWDSNNPRIESCSMSGEHRRIVFNVSTLPGAGWPNGLTIDYDQYRIYWIDARSDSIHSVKYSGEDHHEILRGQEFLAHPFAVSLFGNYVYWTDWRTNALVRAKKWNGDDHKVIQRTVTQPFDLHVYHPMRQPKAPNPCAVNNGGCSDLCLLSFNNTVGCKCPHLKKLKSDGKTCDWDGTFLLFAKSNEIRGVDFKNAYYNVIPSLTGNHVDEPTALDYYAKGQRLYWTDSTLKVINSASLIGTDMETIIDSEIDNPQGFAIDWVAQNMYFSSFSSSMGQGKASISVANLKGAFRTKIITEGLIKPRSLVVDPGNGDLFWVDVDTKGSTQIFSANMDGTYKRILNISDTYRKTIKSLTIDLRAKRLYWINQDGDTYSINHCEYPSLVCNTTIANGNDGNKILQEPAALAVHDGKIYFADKTSLRMVNVDGSGFKVLRDSTPKVTAVRVYQDYNDTVNQCAVNNGGCSQLCLPVTATTKVCHCTAGFKLDIKGTYCQGITSFLMYSTTSDISGIPMGSDMSKADALPPISTIAIARAIDFHAADDYIYWVDQSTFKITRIKRDLSARADVITDGPVRMLGLAVDWIAGNLYWSDLSLGIIEVARLNGSYRYVLLSDTERPGPIALHPTKGKMYWLNSADDHKIEVANLDGSDRSLFLNLTGQQVLAMTIDYDAEKLYYCDKKDDLLWSINLDGTAKTVLLRTNMTDCEALTVFQDHVYWAEIGSNSILRVNKRTGKDVAVVKRNVANLLDLKIFDAKRQLGTNPCAIDNGGCDELCLYTGNRVQCACAHGQLTNGTKCEHYKAFLLYSKVVGLESLHMFDFDSKNAPHEPISNATYMKNVIGLSYDYKNKIIYFSDIQKANIQAVSFDGKNYSVIVEKDVGSAEGLAYDSFFEELYWTSYTHSSISRISRSKVRNDPQVEKVLQLDPEDHPRDIVLDTCQSRMFWTNWNDKAPKIQSAYMSGWDMQSVITTEIRTPNGLTIDHKAQKLYWADARLDKIERINFDGTNRVVVLSNVPQHPFGLAVYGDFIYWTDWVLESVVSANKLTGGDVRWLKRNIPRQPMGIVAVAEDTEDCTKNPCWSEKGGCEQQCSVSANHTVTCSCLGEYRLNPDGKTCRKKDDLLCSNDTFSCVSTIGACIAWELTCDNVSHCPDGSDENHFYCTHRLCPANYFHCNNSKCIRDSKRCNLVNDCGDFSDESYCPCKPDQFKCTNGNCIQSKYRCDHDPDCGDASDEMGCPDKLNCSYFLDSDRSMNLNDLIPCNTTTACILKSWRCDKSNDCWDNSDEQGCPNATNTTSKACPNDGFRCPTTNQCIPSHWKCDKDRDCPHGADEKDCTYSCAENQWSCKDNETCIPRPWLCDGSADCPDGSDEGAHCNQTARVCLENEFKCQSGRCIPISWICDGDMDCTSGEDEKAGHGCVLTACDSDEFRCKNGRCIRQSFHCDHDNDCGDHSDEPDTCVYPTCGPDNFQCQIGVRGIGACIPVSQMCNGVEDCPDGSDESSSKCATQTPKCAPYQFVCHNQDCINKTLACNNFADCADASDEIGCGINQCEARKPCDHYCIDMEPGFRCTCRQGFRLHDDGHTCEDINECETDFPCSHYCKNQVGSYHCSCADGFKLAPNKKSCKAAGDEPVVLLVTERYYIRNISVASGNTTLLAKDLTNAVALDFDWQEQMVYWSDVTSTSSKISRMSVNLDHKDIGDTSKQEVLHRTTVRNPDGIAVDWVARNLYWCDKTTDTIEVSRLNGAYRKVLVKEGLQEPRGLATFPSKGYIFYTDWGDKAHIGKIGMDGTERKAIITENLGWPNAITVDFITKRIIWADARLDYIAFADLDGKHVHKIITQGLAHVFAISVFEDYIYWTDWETKSVEKAHKHSGKDKKTIARFVHRPMDVHVFHPLRQRKVKNETNPCLNNGGCANLCLIKPGGLDRVCACPDYHHLSADKRTCISNCTSSQFACNTTSKCIPFWWKCDNNDDCGDNSDEPPNCPKYNCHQAGLFQCRNASSAHDCISPTQICDGVAQCADQSDEENCESYTCMENQFKCGGNDSRCIPASLRCDGKKDCNGDGEDEKNCAPPTCAGNQFKCANLRCIPYVWRCDGDNDCGDSTDEQPHANCTEQCRKGYLRCNTTGRCIPDSWQCDGDSDCGPNDRSDEPDSCSKFACEGTYFKCANSRCIPGRWRCDYDDDCRDGSDEKGCTPRNCSESEYRCGDNRCIPAAWRCDNKVHCEDGTDEMNCTASSLMCDAKKEFQCTQTKYCIPKEWHCDGEPDCSDTSDEYNCNARNCSSTEFRCANSLCIPDYWQCDGRDDCGDMSDERHCKNYTCPGGYFKCNSSLCISHALRCDGTKHCPGGEDEQQCGVKVCNGASDHKCKSNEQCISSLLLCDRYSDCADGSDEDPALCNILETCQNNVDCAFNAQCKQFSVDKRSIKHCDCRTGFKLTPQPPRCVDINECEQWQSCPQRCLNKPGKHLCKCAQNYMPIANHSRSCVARGDPPYLLVAQENELLYGSVAHTLQHQLFKGSQSRRIDSMDVDIGTSTLFYVSSFTQTGSITKLHIPDSISLDRSPNARRRRKRSAVEQSTVNITGPPLVDPRGITVDWVYKRIYWTDAGSDKIEMSSFDGSNRTTIVSTNLEQPHGIVVDPEGKRIYWSDWGRNAKIESANFDGTNRTPLAVAGIEWPAGLAIDYPNRRLYWSDTKLGRIETSNLDGSNRKIVKHFLPNEDSPYQLAIFEDYLYFTTYRHHHIMKMHKFYANDTHYLGKNLTRIGDLTIIQRYKQEAGYQDNPCQSSNCGPHSLCIPLPELQKTNCVCVNGYKKSPTDGSCVADTNVPGGACTPEFCKHNGTCIHTEAQEPKCQCSPRYGGRRCKLDHCYARCQNGGTCSINNDIDIVCSCPDLYTGPDCGIDKCMGHCMNGGFCIVNKDSKKATCTCHPEFTGPLCEKKKEDVCDDYDCTDNNGHCISGGDKRARCICYGQFKGKHCERCDHKLTCKGGVCKKIGDTYKCQCEPGYNMTRCVNGEMCTYKCVSACKESDYCTQYDTDATCKLDNAVPMCKCSPRYYGSHCIQDKCFLDENVCQNGGTCMYDKNHLQLTCLCPRGFAGRHCEKMVCDQEPCLNGGTCKDSRGGAVCTCKPMYTGDRCEALLGCDTHPCHNQGTCIHKGTQPACSCTPPWQGDHCEQTLQCIQSCHSHGSCDVCKLNSTCQKCSCDKGWDGATCAEPVGYSSTGQSGPGVIAIVVPIIVILLLIIAIMIGVLLYRRKTRNQFKHMRMEDNSNVEISNPIYRQYEEEEEGPGEAVDSAFGFEADKPTNFSNPMYDTLYNESSKELLSPTSEKNQLLSEDNMKTKLLSGSSSSAPDANGQPWTVGSEHTRLLEQDHNEAA